MEQTQPLDRPLGQPFGQPLGQPLGQALDILKALANGIDPHTGKPLPAESVVQHPDTVRALFHAIQALGKARPSKIQPNAGKPWTAEEDTRLLAAFEAGQSPDAIAAAHARSRIAIEARLAKLGRIPMPAGMRVPARANPLLA